MDTTRANRRQLFGGGLSRRDLMQAGGMTLLASAALPACDALSTDPEGSGDGGSRSGSAPKGREAPSLAQRVKSGDLPPVDERLPEEPLVVEPVDRVGVYGGEWNSAMLGPSDDAWLGRTVGYENLVRWDRDFQKVIPNVATAVEAEDGGRAYVVSLRPGMKWSDGSPFTADDLVFAYDDVLTNTDLFPVPPSLYVVGDEPGRIEKVDDHTVRFVFAVPNSVFVENLATPYAADITSLPKAFLQQFHKDYNPEVQQVAEEAAFPSWIELFLARADTWNTKELPRLHGWLPLTVFGEGSRVVYDRNPYYFKTDPDGSQLPYIDRFVSRIIADPQVMVIAASNGEIDMQDRTINTLSNKPVLARNRESGGYHFFDEMPSDSSACVIALNLNHPNEVMREVFGNRDFRVALSHAINRDEIIDVVYQRQGEPYQVAPRENSPFYDEEMAKQYTAYDPDTANQLLDRAGFSERDGDGFRLGPDGNRIRFDVEVPTAFRAEWPDVLELVRGYWVEVGVDGRVKNEDRALFDERTGAGIHDAAVWQAEGGGWIEPILRTDWYFPCQNESMNYAPSWMQWYQTRGQAGDEPPALVRRQMELFGETREIMDTAERRRVMMEVLGLAKEFFYHIGTVLAPPSYGIAKNNFHNVPKQVPQSFIYPTPAPTSPEQFFISEG